MLKNSHGAFHIGFLYHCHLFIVTSLEYLQQQLYIQAVHMVFVRLSTEFVS